MTEAVEMCPFCTEENVFPGWNVREQGYVARCQHCGEEIMLCDECVHDEDSTHQCDWHEVDTGKGYSEGHCYRGVTKHRFEGRRDDE